MTDRIKGFYVALDKDLRVDDAQPLIDAVKQMKHVMDVEVSISDVDLWTA